jgi:DNA-binding response OmpR family regulator
LPDLIVSDVMMPPPDGFELRQRLSKRPTTADIPFIFLTARTDPVEKRRALETGISDYITKPFDREEFIARIGAALRRRSWQLHSPLPSGGGRNER